jgi:hypothetical protein
MASDARAQVRGHAPSAARALRLQALELPALEAARELTLREAESDDEEGDGIAAVALRSVRSPARAGAAYRRLCACARACSIAHVRACGRFLARMCACPSRAPKPLCAQAPAHLARFSIAHRVYLITKARTDDGAAQRVFDAMHKSSASIWCHRCSLHAAAIASGNHASL